LVKWERSNVGLGFEAEGECFLLEGDLRGSGREGGRKGGLRCLSQIIREDQKWRKTDERIRDAEAPSERKELLAAVWVPWGFTETNTERGRKGGRAGGRKGGRTYQRGGGTVREERAIGSSVGPMGLDKSRLELSEGIGGRLALDPVLDRVAVHGDDFLRRQEGGREGGKEG